MKRMRQFLRFTGVVGAVVVITGCAYDAAVQRLAPAEQAEFRANSKIMTSTQARTYLAKATAAERAAYLKEVGITQRFQRLEPQDREAVLAGFPREGMSAEAMRFLWGEPYYTEGWTGRWEHWFYLGSSLSLADYGNDYSSGGTMVDVYLVDGRVVWWLEFVPSDDDNEDSRR